MSELKESAGAQQHFTDLCRLLGEPTPAEADPEGKWYCFERIARKNGERLGFADVWKRGCFAWEYKNKGTDLGIAFGQLHQYALALENPPLLVVSDMERILIRTNWTNTVTETLEFSLKDLLNFSVREKLKWAMSEPERLRPGRTRHALTEQAASAFADLAHALRDRGHAPYAVANFVNRLVFCMFAEDVELLKGKLFTKLLESTRKNPRIFFELSSKLFRAMASGGFIGFDRVNWFNGGLFSDDSSLPLEKDDIKTLLKTAELDWSEIDPSILGTLFERGLDPDKRSQLGAHYTDREKILMIVEPVIVRPWRDEWERTKPAIAAAVDLAITKKTKRSKENHFRLAENLLKEFLDRLRAFTVLDPACGSGNFLYLALHALKDLELRVQLEAEKMGLPRSFPEIGPANVLGIELNPYAAELARVSVWIGEIQWMRRNGFSEMRDPILKPMDNIECRDAVLNPDGTEADWPKADVVIGNPPFLGNRKARTTLGDDYVEMLSRTYKGLISGKPDLVCYWFAKAGKLVAEGKVKRAGLVATNSIRGGTNRRVLDRIAEKGAIFEAWDDEEWTVEGAAVRVSIVCFTHANCGLAARLNGTEESRINADLTAGPLDVTRAKRLPENRNVAFQGNIKRGSFDIPGDLARQWLQLPSNPNGCRNSDVLKPWVNGMDVTRRPAGKWIVDFGSLMQEEDAALYEAPFAHLAELVRPMRMQTSEPASREHWFRHWNPRPEMQQAISALDRFIATPTLAKYRLFVWLDARVCPDHQLIAIARDDDTTFGVLHSRFHEAWSLRLGSSLEDRPRYTPTTTFAKFPFPKGLSPDIPASGYAEDPRAIAIARAARRMVEFRDRWFNPPELIEWVDEPVPGYPKRAVPRNAKAERELRDRTLTNLYNRRPQWLADAHLAIDSAVASAYGWETEISESDALKKLMQLNSERSAESGTVQR